jgi:hypothetical protein
MDDNASITDSVMSVGVVKIRRTETERIEYFRNQPECGTLEPHRAFCTRCNKFVNLGRKQTYAVRPWETHRSKCDQQVLSSHMCVSVIANDVPTISFFCVRVIAMGRIPIYKVNKVTKKATRHLRSIPQPRDVPHAKRWRKEKLSWRLILGCQLSSQMKSSAENARSGSDSQARWSMRLDIGTRTR